MVWHLKTGPRRFDSDQRPNTMESRGAPDFYAPNSDKLEKQTSSNIESTRQSTRLLWVERLPSGWGATSLPVLVCKSHGLRFPRTTCCGPLLFLHAAKDPEYASWVVSLKLLIRNDRNEILGNTDPKPNEFHYKICIRFRGHGSRWIILDQHAIGTKLRDSMILMLFQDYGEKTWKNNVHVQKLSAVLLDPMKRFFHQKESLSPQLSSRLPVKAKCVSPPLPSASRFLPITVANFINWLGGSVYSVYTLSRAH